MKNLTIENQGGVSQLVYKIGEDDVIDTMSLGMLRNNNIEGISKIVYTQKDEEKYFKYQIAGKVTLTDYFSGTINKKRLLNVFASILSAVISAEEYMIDFNCLLFDKDRIYVDVTTGKAEMICLPIVDKEREEANLSLFFKNIIFSSQFDYTENSNHVAIIMNYLNSSPSLKAEDFLGVINKLMNNIDPTGGMGQSNHPQASAQLVQPQVPVQHVQPQVPKQRVQQQTPAQQVQPQAPVQQVQPQVQSQPKVTSAQQQKVNNSASTQMNIPGAAPQKESVNSSSDTGEKMSAFYLLQHFNKENLEKFKKQGSAKKGEVTSKKEKKGKRTGGNATAFAVPGQQSTNTSFAVPGQKSTNASFAVPGQATVANNNVSVNASQVTPQQQNQPQQQSAQPNPSFTPESYGQTSGNFGETVVLNQSMGFGETTVLSADALAPKSPFLIRQKNNEKINIDKAVFKIGKEKSYVDYFIGDNTAISRSHASIITKGENYYVVDSNSTNHTYVNGTMIQGDVETVIEHGTKIRLANEEFTFFLY